MSHQERAIKNVETGQLMTEWRDMPKEHILEAISKSQTPDRYVVMVRTVTEWEVEP